MLSFTFGRLLNTGDKYDNVISDAEMYLLYAYGQLNGGQPQYHGNNRYFTPLAFEPELAYSTEDGVWSSSWVFSSGFEVVTFNLSTTYDGWLGLGFSESGGMRDSDFIVAWFDSEGALQVADRFADPNAPQGHGLPALDTALGGTNDIYNVSGSVSIRNIARLSFFLFLVCFFLTSLLFCFFVLFFSLSLSLEKHH